MTMLLRNVIASVQNGILRSGMSFETYMQAGRQGLGTAYKNLHTLRNSQGDNGGIGMDLKTQHFKRDCTTEE
jgi:hypothetical protein